MDWLERLNRLPGRIPLLDGSDHSFTGGLPATRPSRFAVDVSYWAYNRHLPDNVPHRHAYFEVCLVGDHGSGWYMVEGRRYPIGPGDIFFSRPGVLHQIVNNPDTPQMELFWVTFHTDLPDEPGGGLVSLFRHFADAANILVVPDEGGTIRASWEALRSTAGSPASNGPGFAARIHALIVALLIGIAEAGSGLPDSSESRDLDSLGAEAAAQRAVRYIHEHLGSPLSVPEVAEFVGVSPRHLTRLLARFTGTAPAAYIETARIQRARTLLLRTDDPIKQIGAQIGYEDVHHFTRVFTRAVGCPPGTFRKTRGAAARPVQHGPDIREPGTLV